MKVFDRYLLQLFLRVLLVCMFSITGLYVVVDFCNNMDEFLGYGSERGYLAVIGEYYGPRIPWFFDRISGLLALIAAMFAITWLQRTNEMTAVLAAGISKTRIIKPLVCAAVAVSLLAAANRELIIPANRDKLLRNAQDWLGQAPRPVEPVLDHRTDILLNGLNTYARDGRIDKPSFLLHHPIGDFGKMLKAETANYSPPKSGRPGGYLLQGVFEPADLSQTPSGSLTAESEPIIFSPYDTEWLRPDECFVVSEIDFQQLAGGSQWRQFASTGELLAGLRNPSQDYGADVRVMIHSRFIQPALDMTLFFLGLPLVLTRESRNIFVAAGWCLLVVTGFFAVVLLSQAMGSSGYLLGPELAAWLPLFVFVPVAAALRPEA